MRFTVYGKIPEFFIYGDEDDDDYDDDADDDDDDDDDNRDMEIASSPVLAVLVT